jgi:hypothetical protein
VLWQGVLIPPTAVGGCFRSFPKDNPTNGSWWMFQILSQEQSHQRQLVDASDLFYRQCPGRRTIPPTAVGGCFRSFPKNNPTNGSWWMLQIFSTGNVQDAEQSHQRQLVDVSDPFPGTIPPTAVGGCFRSFLQAMSRTQNNPTNGSWWMLQILSNSLAS